MAKQRAKEKRQPAHHTVAVPAPHRFAYFYAIIAVAVFMVFSPALVAQFVDWDDPLNVTQNPYLHPPSLGNLAYLWTHEYKNLYVPLVYTSFIIDQFVGAGKAWSFHFTNVALHAISGCLAFWILRTLLATIFPAIAQTSISRTALVASLLYALHPMQVEPVAWVTGRKDTLSGALALASVALFIRGLASDRLLRGYYAAALVAFFLALLAKPSIASLPLGLAAMAFLIFRKPLRQTALVTAPFFILGLAWAFATSRVQAIPEHLKSSYPGALLRPFVAADTLAFYLWKVLLPINLSPVYDRRILEVASSPLPFVLLPALLIGFGLLLWKNRIVACASIIFIALVFPVLGFVPFLYQVYATVADRYVYVALLGPALAVAYALLRTKPGFSYLAYALIAVFAFLSFRQCFAWQSSESLWRHAYKVAPGVAVTNTNLGIIERTRGNLPAATKHYEQAIKLDPRSPEAYHNLGILYVRQDRLPEAETSFKKAAELLPGNPAPLEALKDVQQKLRVSKGS